MVYRRCYIQCYSRWYIDCRPCYIQCYRRWYMVYRRSYILRYRRWYMVYRGVTYCVTDGGTRCTEGYLLCDAKPVQVFRGGCADHEGVSAAVNQERIDFVHNGVVEGLCDCLQHSSGVQRMVTTLTTESFVIACSTAVVFRGW